MDEDQTWVFIKLDLNNEWNFSSSVDNVGSFIYAVIPLTRVIITLFQTICRSQATAVSPVPWKHHDATDICLKAGTLYQTNSSSDDISKVIIYVIPCNPWTSKTSCMFILLFVDIIALIFDTKHLLVSLIYLINAHTQVYMHALVR